MAKPTIKETLAELISLHQQMNELALAKIEAVKKNDMSALNDIIKQETAFIKKLAKAEQSRVQAVDEFAKGEGIAKEDITIEALIFHSPLEERPQLEELFQSLIKEITHLKELNKLNKTLIEDSLRFINLSLDLLSPDITDMNYERPSTKEDDFSTPVGRSLFDSRA